MTEIEKKKAKEVLDTLLIDSIKLKESNVYCGGGMVHTIEIKTANSNFIRDFLLFERVQKSATSEEFEKWVNSRRYE